MFFPHKQIVWALAQNLEDCGVFENVYRRLVLETPHPGSKELQPDSPSLLKAFLTQDLPPAEEAERIVSRLTQLAAQHEMRLSDLHWWDILSRTRALKGILHSGDRKVAIYFYWKKTSTIEANALAAGEACYGLLFDPSEPGGYSIKFEAQTYQEMRLQYETWLRQPIFPQKDR